MQTSRVGSETQDAELLRYLLLNWRSTLIGMFAANVGDRDVAMRAINRCAHILNMLDSETSKTGYPSGQKSILGQLALLISEIEYLTELKNADNPELPEL